MSSEAPSIAVVVAVRNGVKYIAQCLDSFAEQTWGAKELVVMDGASSDGTQDVIRSRASAIRHWESEPDKGIYSAWNKALRHVDSEWVYFLGADDYFWSKDVLERMAGHLVLAYPQHRVVYGQVASVSETGDVIVLEGTSWEKARRRVSSEMTIPHQGVMHHRSLFTSDSPFDETFRIAGDYDLLLPELVGAGALYVPDIVVAGMRVGGYSTTPAFALATLREFRRAQLKQGQRRATWSWRWTYLKAALRYAFSAILGQRLTRLITNAYRILTGRPPRRMAF
jgi:glycosyltransferase involved in cell wall biosynthesis